jgi:hypothetical protein
MKYSVLGANCIADGGAPEPKLTVVNGDIVIEFWANHHFHPEFGMHDKGRITFFHCHKYDFEGTNDEGYFMGQHRFNDEQLPWGDFYQLHDTAWEIDFPPNPSLLTEFKNKDQLNHYLLFFKDECFECVAKSYKIEIIKA